MEVMSEEYIYILGDNCNPNNIMLGKMYQSLRSWCVNWGQEEMNEDEEGSWERYRLFFQQRATIKNEQCQPPSSSCWIMYVLLLLYWQYTSSHHVAMVAWKFFASFLSCSSRQFLRNVECGILNEVSLRLATTIVDNWHWYLALLYLLEWFQIQ